MYSSAITEDPKWRNYRLKWNDRNCDDSHPFFCQVPMKLSGIKQGTCESGWKFFCDKKERCACYKYINLRKNWLDASDQCMKMNAHLPSIHSKEEAR
jgi:hypothetical protein